MISQYRTADSYRKIILSRIQAEGYIHTRCFDELLTLLAFELKSLGYEVEIKINGIGGRDTLTLMMGGHLLDSNTKSALPPSVIHYNLEQIGSDSMVTPQETAAYQGMVWEYAAKNLPYWKGRGVFVPIGYSAANRVLTLSKEPDIDVLFYGSVNERRQVILNAFFEKGVRVKTLFGVYGEERDAWIARSKVVLNLHAYEACIFEQVRVSYLLANGVCVVAEGGDETEIPTLYRFAAEVVPYEQLVERCIEYVQNDALRRERAQAGAACFQTISARMLLQNALAQTLIPL